MDITTELLAEIGGQRLDRYISEHMPQISRAVVQRLIEQGHVRVGGKERKSSYRVQTGEVISVRMPPPEPTAVGAEDIPLQIVYEDADVIVVNKPAGMVVHPAAGHASGTLVNAVLGYAPELEVGGEERPGIVHRLDADTSGLIVVAKNDRALRDLQEQFKSRRVHKTYLALVEGSVVPPRGRIEAPIGRDPKHRQKMAVITAGGKARDAVTIYQTIASSEGYTLVAAEPRTGRTHQIRVHLAFLGFPVVGDAMYGKKRNKLGLTRQFLHAWKITFRLPSDGELELTAPLPEDLSSGLEALGLGVASIQ